MCTRCGTPVATTASMTRSVPPTPSARRWASRCEGWKPHARCTTASAPSQAVRSAPVSASSVRSAATHSIAGNDTSLVGGRRTTPTSSCPPSSASRRTRAEPTLPLAPVMTMRMRDLYPVAGWADSARGVGRPSLGDADERLGDVVVPVQAPDQGDRGGLEVGDDAGHDVLALVQSRDGHGYDDDAGAGGDRLDRLLLAHRRPVELVGCGCPSARVGADELLVVEVTGRDLLVGGGEHVVARGHGHLQLVVEPDAVQPVPVDGEAYERHVEAPVAHAVELVGLRQRHELQPLATAVAPVACPLVGGRAGDEADAKGVGHGPSLGVPTHRGSRSPRRW